MKFKPLEKNGIDNSEKRLRGAPDCAITKCPANKIGRCIRIGECLIEENKPCYYNTNNPEDGNS